MFGQCPLPTASFFSPPVPIRVSNASIHEHCCTSETPTSKDETDVVSEIDILPAAGLRKPGVVITAADFVHNSH